MVQVKEFNDVDYNNLPERTLIFGPPGTGKTSVLENLFNDFRQYNNINDGLYLTYSRPMAEEARDRMNLDKHNVATMHSYFSHVLGWTMDMFLNLQDYINFAKMFGLSVRFNFNVENIEDIVEENIYMYDDLSLFLSSYNYLYNVYYNNPEKHLDDVNNRLFEMANQKKNLNFPFLFYKYEEYKRKLGKMDYTDILVSIYNQPDLLPFLKFLEIDEAQDLRPIMWAIINKWQDKIEKVVVVGDVNQSLYVYDGVNIYDFFNLKNLYDPFHLVKTYRIPNEILNYSKSIINEISIKEEQPLYSVNPNNGTVRFYSSFIDALYDFISLDGSKWILARTISIIQSIINILQSHHIIYSVINPRHQYLTPWTYHNIRVYNILNNYPPKDYSEMKTLILLLPASVLRRGIKSKFQAGEPLPPTIDKYLDTNIFESLFRTKITRMEIINLLDIDPMVKETIINNLTLVPETIDYDNILKIDTIHAAKGKEVDNVLLVKNVTWKIVQSINNSMDGKDNEMRIHYVGATRARKNLFVVSDRELSNFSI